MKHLRTGVRVTLKHVLTKDKKIFKVGNVVTLGRRFQDGWEIKSNKGFTRAGYQRKHFTVPAGYDKPAVKKQNKNVVISDAVLKHLYEKAPASTQQEMRKTYPKLFNTEPVLKSFTKSILTRSDLIGKLNYEKDNMNFTCSLFYRTPVGNSMRLDLNNNTHFEFTLGADKSEVFIVPKQK